MKKSISFLRSIITAILLIVATASFAQSSMLKHIVARGETLEDIATRYQTTTQIIIQNNPQASQFIYVGMELQIPTPQQPTVTTPQQTQTPNQTTQSDNGVQVSETEPIQSNRGNILLSTKRIDEPQKNYSQYPASRLGVNLHGYFDADIVKYGSNISFEGLCKGDSSPFGVDFSTGWNIMWNPKFDISSCVLGLGPFWSTKLSESVDLYIPVKLMCVATLDDNDKWHYVWGCRINPLICMQSFTCGIFADIAKDAAFGLSFGFLFAQ